MDIKDNYSKYLIIIFSLIVIYLVFLLIKPFIAALLWATLLTYIFYPIYKFINKPIKNSNVSAVITIILIIIIIIIPVIFVANTLIKESVNFYNYIKEINIEQITAPLQLSLDKVNLETSISKFIESTSTKLIFNMSNFLFSIPNKILEFIILVFTMFYLFRDGPILVNNIKGEIPLKEEDKNKLFKDFNKIGRAVVYGFLFGALAQGITGAIGFLVFGVTNPLLWGAVMAILSLIPILGPFLVWVPAALILIINGNVISGIGLLIYGILIISTIDNVIRHKFITKNSDVHPILILLGVISGIKVFGLIGIVLGPLILALFTMIFKFYREARD